MPFTGLKTSGDELPASVLDGSILELRPITAVKTIPSTLITATMAADLELILPLAALNVYDFVFVGYATSAANNTGDIAYQFTYPTGASVDAHQIGAHNSLAGGSQAADSEVQALIADAASPIGNFPFGTSTVPTGHMIVGRITMGSTAGNLQLWVAQNTASGTTTMLARSRLTAVMVG